MALRQIILATCSLFASAILPASAQDVTKLTSFSDWSLFTDGKTPHLFCFLTSEPKSSEPADTAREAPRIYISAWPKDGVKSEFSARLGFPPKKNTEVTAAVAKDSFKMFAADDRGFVQDATQELKLLDAMRKGAKLAVVATTATGVNVTDTYSLNGLGQAMTELQSTCH